MACPRAAVGMSAPTRAALSPAADACKRAVIAFRAAVKGASPNLFPDTRHGASANANGTANIVSDLLAALPHSTAQGLSLTAAAAVRLRDDNEASGGGGARRGRGDGNGLQLAEQQQRGGSRSVRARVLEAVERHLGEKFFANCELHHLQLNEQDVSTLCHAFSRVPASRHPHFWTGVIRVLETLLRKGVGVVGVVSWCGSYASKEEVDGEKENKQKKFAFTPQGLALTLNGLSHAVSAASTTWSGESRGRATEGDPSSSAARRDEQLQLELSDVACARLELLAVECGERFSVAQLAMVCNSFAKLSFKKRSFIQLPIFKQILNLEDAAAQKEMVMGDLHLQDRFRSICVVVNACAKVLLDEVDLMDCRAGIMMKTPTTTPGVAVVRERVANFLECFRLGADDGHGLTSLNLLRRQSEQHLAMYLHAMGRFQAANEVVARRIADAYWASTVRMRTQEATYFHATHGFCTVALALARLGLRDERYHSTTPQTITKNSAMLLFSERQHLVNYAFAACLAHFNREEAQVLAPARGQESSAESSQNVEARRGFAKMLHGVVGELMEPLGLWRTTGLDRDRKRSQPTSQERRSCRPRQFVLHEDTPGEREGDEAHAAVWQDGHWTNLENRLSPHARSQLLACLACANALDKNNRIRGTRTMMASTSRWHLRFYERLIALVEGTTSSSEFLATPAGSPFQGEVYAALKRALRPRGVDDVSAESGGESWIVAKESRAAQYFVDMVVSRTPTDRTSDRLLT